MKLLSVEAVQRGFAAARDSQPENGHGGARVLFRALFLMALSLSAAILTTAQAPPVPPGGSVYASGLEGPSGITFGPDGLLYVAEAGLGGTTPTPANCQAVVPPVGPYTGGLTARISRIESNGTRTTVATNLPSGQSALPSGDTDGVADVEFVDGQLYALTAGGGCSHGNPNFPNSVVRIDERHGTAQIAANLSQFFVNHPVAHPNNGPTGDFEPDGVPYQMKGYLGDLLVVEPNHGRLLRVNLTHPGQPAIQQISDISAPVGHVVPTGISGRDDRFYIGNLGHFPIVVGSSNVYQVTHDGFADVCAGVFQCRRQSRAWKRADFANYRDEGGGNRQRPQRTYSDDPGLT